MDNLVYYASYIKSSTINHTFKTIWYIHAGEIFQDGFPRKNFNSRELQLRFRKAGSGFTDKQQMVHIVGYKHGTTYWERTHISCYISSEFQS